MSNVFTFKTLRSPIIRVTSINQNMVRLRVNIECRSRSNLNEGFKPVSGDVTNYLFRILLYRHPLDWTISYQKIIQESDFKESSTDSAYKIYSNEIDIINLNSSVVYLIKLEHEISMASDEFFPSTHFVTSNIVKFATLQKSLFIFCRFCNHF